MKILKQRNKECIVKVYFSKATINEKEITETFFMSLARLNAILYHLWPRSKHLYSVHALYMKRKFSLIIHGGRTNGWAPLTKTYCFHFE